MYYVYRYMLGDQWIYVGKSKNNLMQRIYDHSKDSRFEKYHEAQIEYIELNTSSDMDITESMLIKTMHPIINVVDSTDGSVPFGYDESLINWKPIAEYIPKTKSEASRKKELIMSPSYLNNADIELFIADILSRTDPLGMRWVLNEWCRVEYIPYDEAYNALSVPTDIRHCKFCESLRRHLNTIIKGTSYQYRVHDGNNDIVLVIGRVGRDNISDFLL